MAKSLGHVAVLAGGRSERMGMDKAVVRVGGVMMLERVVRAAMGLGLPVLVVGRAAAPAEWPEDLLAPRVRFVADRGEAFAGPVGGVMTALEAVGGAVLVAGCDMPLLRVETLRALMAAHEGAAAGTWATLAVSRDAQGREYAEPALAVYAPEILPRLEEMMRTGRKSLQPLLKEERVGRWEVAGEAAGEMLNVNDAAGAAEAERVLARVKST